MYYPNKMEFIKLAKKGNIIPVCREIIADMETPVSAFKKIESDFSYLLESVEGGEKFARYSFLGSDPVLIFKSKGNNIEIIENKKTRKFTGKPLDELKNLFSIYKPVKLPDLPRFHGGLVGYLGYDAIRYIENIPDKNPDDLKIPDIQMVLTDTILAFDHVKHKIIIICNAHVTKNPSSAYNLAVNKINKLVRKLQTPIKGKTEIEIEKRKMVPIRSNMSRTDFQDMVKKGVKHIENGDIIQVVLSQRFQTKIKSDPFNIYRMLRALNPSPYMYYLKFGNTKLIGTSPEVMVRLDKDIATIRPIAGTRKRGENEQEDLTLEKDLLADTKEKAEHIMLVDLARNDLGRVCDFGSVKINELMGIEKYSHVMHIVSDVSGNLKKGMDGFDLIKATFPAGTVTGAPKIRAMQIIDELENIKRGPYAGTIGYFSFNGDIDSCITIRTILSIGNNAYIQAGAGIVADSIPEKEFEETVNKAKAMLKAIEYTQG